MSAVFGTLALSAAAAIAFAAGTSLLVGAFWPLLQRGASRRHPAARARFAFGAAVAPAIAPLVGVGLCLAPGVLVWLGLHGDHCLEHPSHPHLCLVHPSAMLPTAVVLQGVAAFAATLLGAALVQIVVRVASGRRSLARLRSAASRCTEPGVYLVESDRAFSLTAGLGRSGIFLSTALAEALAPTHLTAVVSHERAHVRSRDGLKTLAARVLSWPHLPWVRRSILAELELSMERACDEQAGQEVGDRLVVAEAILAAERLVASAPRRNSLLGSPLLAFGGSSVPARVRGLLAEPVADRRPAAGWVACGVLGVCILLAEPLHHATEHALGLLLGVH